MSKMLDEIRQQPTALERTFRSELKGVEKLRALPDVNLSVINAELDDLIIAVDSLPLEQDRVGQSQPALSATPAVRTESNIWQRLLREIWEDARSLVRIENMHKNELPLLAPTQVFFLRENLKSRLLSARLALLSHDEASFKLDLKLAQDWLIRYFDSTSAATGQALSRLHKLRQSSIHIELPDVSASLEAARNYRASLAKSAK